MILPVRGGRRGARAHRPGRPRPAGRPARRHRRHRRPRGGLRPRLPPDLAAAALALGADRGRPAPRRGDAARLAVQGRRALLRPRRPPPRLGGQVPGPRRHRRLRDRGHDPAQARADLRVSELPLKDHERLFRERVPLSAGAARADLALGPVGLRLAGRDGRGVGLPDDAGARSLRRPPRGRQALVRAGVRRRSRRCSPRAG